MKYKNVNISSKNAATSETTTAAKI